METTKYIKALKYIEAGLSVIPTNKDTKRPVVDEWKPLMERLATKKELKKWFSSNSNNVAAIAGKVSGNLEFLDFDCEGEKFQQWAPEVQERNPNLLEKLVLEKSPHGVHVSYRCTESVPGNKKLSRKGIKVEGPGEYTYKGKSFKAAKYNDQWFIIPILIETRGEGGYCIVDPSDGYKLTQGSYTNLPVLTAEEREALIQSAYACNEWFPPQDIKPVNKTPKSSDLPGDDFNNRGDIVPILEKHGWTSTGRTGQLGDGTRTEYFRRPGKDKGSSATLIDGKIFYCFSSNAYPFEGDRAYSPFGVYALLENNGGFSQSAKELLKMGFGKKDEKNPQQRGVGGVTIGELSQRYSKKVEWLWRNHIPARMPSMLSSREGDGKTTLGLASSNEILKTHPEGIIVWVATEGAIIDTVHKAEEIGEELLKSRFVVAQKPDKTFIFNFANEFDRKAFSKFLGQYDEPILAVWIDSIRGFSPYSENDDMTGKVMLKLNSIVCDGHNAGLIYIHHQNKKQGVPLLDKTSGSTALTSAVRLVLCIEKTTTFTRVIRAGKNNVSSILPELSCVKSEGEIQFFEGEKTDIRKRDEAEVFLINIFKKQDEYFAYEIYEESENLGFSKSLLKQVKNSLPIEVIHKKVGDPWTWKWKAPVQGIVEPLEKKENKDKKNVIKSTRDTRNTRISPQETQETQGTQGTFGKQEEKSIKSMNNNNKLTTENSLFSDTRGSFEEIPPEGVPF